MYTDGIGGRGSVEFEVEIEEVEFGVVVDVEGEERPARRRTTAARMWTTTVQSLPPLKLRAVCSSL